MGTWVFKREDPIFNNKIYQTHHTWQLQAKFFLLTLNYLSVYFQTLCHKSNEQM